MDGFAKQIRHLSGPFLTGIQFREILQLPEQVRKANLMVQEMQGEISLMHFCMKSRRKAYGTLRRLPQTVAQNERNIVTVIENYRMPYAKLPQSPATATLLEPIQYLRNESLAQDNSLHRGAFPLVWNSCLRSNLSHTRKLLPLTRGCTDIFHSLSTTQNISEQKSAGW